MSEQQKQIQKSKLRQILAGYQNEMLSKNNPLEYQRAAEILKDISSLLGNITDQIIVADHNYSVVLLAELEKEEKANRAKIKAEISEEFQKKQQARNTKELANSLIGSLKYFCNAKKEEWPAGKTM